jgi:hypothetical protein
LLQQVYQRWYTEQRALAWGGFGGFGGFGGCGGFGCGGCGFGFGFGCAAPLFPTFV